MANQRTQDVRSAVANALRYYRYRGASVKSIDSYVSIRTDRQNYKSQRNSTLELLRNEGYAEKRGSLWYLHPDAFELSRGDAFIPEFEETDFYVAFALVGCGNDCDLVKLIGTFDFVVRALPSFDELYGGLNRLVAARLVAYTRSLFSPTEHAGQLFAKAKNAAKSSMYGQLKAFQRLIQCPCCGVTLGRVEWRVPLTQEQFSSALVEYRRRP